MTRSTALTESEWLACGNPFELLEFLSQKGQPRRWLSWFSGRPGQENARKLRLFACACCRRIWQLLPDERLRAAVEIAERYADGKASRKELRSAAAVVEATAAQIVDVRSMSGRWMEIAKSSATQAVIAALAETDPADKATVSALDAIRAWAQATPEEVARRFGLGPKPAPPPSIVFVGQMPSAPASPSFSPEDAWIAEGKAQSDLIRDIFGNPFRTIALDLSWSSPAVVSLATAIYDGRCFEQMPELAEALAQAGCNHLTS